jgi:muconolactone delta-isomerase
MGLIIWNSLILKTYTILEMEKIIVKKFKAQIETKRFKKNQDIWIECQHANHISCVARWRGRGRYVAYTMSIYPSDTGNYVNKILGSLDNIKEVEVDIDFAKRHNLSLINIS